MKWAGSIVAICSLMLNCLRLCFKKFFAIAAAMWILGLLSVGCFNFNASDSESRRLKTWLIYGEIPHMVPFFDMDVKVWGLQSLVWDPFVVLDKKGQWQKNIVQSWSFSPDFKVGAFTVASDLKWNDQSPVTEEDFKFSLEFYKFKKLKAAHWQGVFGAIEDVSFKSGVLKITLAKAQGFEIWNQILSMARLLPARVLDSEDLNPAQILNTGPYRLQNFSSTKTWSLIINPHSWWFTSSKKWTTDQLPSEIWIQKALSKSVIQTGLRQKRFAAYVDYGRLRLNALDYNAIYSQNISKNLLLNFKDSDLKELEFRKCVQGSLPSTLRLQKLGHKDVDFKWRQMQDQIRAAKWDLEALRLQCMKSYSKAMTVHYVLDEDRKWLEVWQEEAKQWGIALELESVGESKLARLLQEKNYQVMVSESVLGHLDQWPYEVFHSKGLYNHQSWADDRLDSLLKEKSQHFEFSDRQEVNVRIHNFVLSQFGILYLYEWERPLAWSYLPCRNTDQFLWWNLLECFAH